MSNNNSINLIVSLDLGNGFNKGYIHGGHTFTSPSIIAPLNDKDKSYSDRQSESPYSIAKNYSKYMDETIISDSLKNGKSNRLLIGDRAEDSDQMHGFNPKDKTFKSKSDLSIILIDGIIAGKSIEFYMNKHNSIPKDLTINIGMVTALPLREFNRPNIIDNYRKRFTQNKHTVVIHNLSKDNDVSVHIKFNKGRVYVAPEDTIGMFKIKNDAPKDMQESISKDILSQLQNNKNSSKESRAYWTRWSRKTTGNSSYSKLMNIMNNSLGIDIGHKTTDIVVTKKDSSPILSTSDSIYDGIGEVIDESMKHDSSFNTDDSITFIKNLLQDTHGLSDLMRSQNRAWEAVKYCEKPLVRKITDEVEPILKNQKYNVQIIYIYGGGSIILKEGLQKSLSNISSSKPIVFIDNKYAQYMNLLGIRAIADSLIGHNDL